MPVKNVAQLIVYSLFKACFFGKGTFKTWKILIFIPLSLEQQRQALLPAGTQHIWTERKVKVSELP